MRGGKMKTICSSTWSWIVQVTVFVPCVSEFVLAGNKRLRYPLTRAKCLDCFGERIFRLTQQSKQRQKMQLVSCLRGASLSTEIYFLSPVGLPPQTLEGKSGFSCYLTRPAVCAELKLERTQAGRRYSFRVISGFPFKGAFWGENRLHSHAAPCSVWLPHPLFLPANQIKSWKCSFALEDFEIPGGGASLPPITVYPKYISNHSLFHHFSKKTNFLVIFF